MTAPSQFALYLHESETDHLQSLGNNYTNDKTRDTDNNMARVEYKGTTAVPARPAQTQSGDDSMDTGSEQDAPDDTPAIVAGEVNNLQYSAQVVALTTSHIGTTATEGSSGSQLDADLLTQMNTLQADKQQAIQARNLADSQRQTAAQGPGR